MPLQLVLESLDSLPESIHDMYEEKDGKFYLIPPEGFESPDDVKGLKTALEREREGRREAERKAKAAADANAHIDKKKYDELLERERKAEEDKALEAGEFEKIKAQMVEQHQAALENKDQEIKRLTDQLNVIVRENRVIEAVTKAKGNVELLKPHVLGRTKLNTEDFSLTVLEPDGSPKVDGQGKPATLDALIAEMAADQIFASAFAGTDSSGSGSEPQKGNDGKSNVPGGGKPPKEGLRRSTMTERDKVDFQKEYGIEALLDLPL